MRGQALEHALVRQARGEIVASLEHEFSTVCRAESLPTAVTGRRRWQRTGFLVAGICAITRYGIARVMYVMCITCILSSAAAHCLQVIHRCCSRTGMCRASSAARHDRRRAVRIECEAATPCANE
jgi:hypothetical protein